MVLGGPSHKSGSSRARAQRARKGHAKRRAKMLGTGNSGYKGSRKNRTKSTWNTLWR